MNGQENGFQFNNYYNDDGVSYIWTRIGMNPNLTFYVVKENITLDWDWSSLSYCLNLTLKDIEENQKLPWNWFSLSERRILIIYNLYIWIL